MRDELAQGMEALVSGKKIQFSIQIGHVFYIYIR